MLKNHQGGRRGYRQYSHHKVMDHSRMSTNEADLLTFLLTCLSLPLHAIEAKAFGVFDNLLIPTEALTSIFSKFIELQSSLTEIYS